jgi:hypothetical protein
MGVALQTGKPADTPPWPPAPRHATRSPWGVRGGRVDDGGPPPTGRLGAARGATLATNAMVKLATQLCAEAETALGLELTLPNIRRVLRPLVRPQRESR